MSGYEYTLKFRSSTDYGNADALSRPSLPVILKKVDVPPELVLLTEHLENSPVTAHDIQVWTRRDPELARVCIFGNDGQKKLMHN